MLCPNCNNEIPDKSKFCIKCGKQINQTEPQETPPKEPTDESYKLLSTIVAITAGASSAEEAVEALLKRGKFFLEEGNYKAADIYFDRALDLKPDSAQAYICKLCVEKKVSEEDKLASLSEPLGESGNFQKALRFADEKYKATLLEYNQSILARCQEQIYVSAKRKMELDYSQEQMIRLYQEAEKDFRKISGYLDADILAERCFVLAKTAKEAIYQAAKKEMEAEHPLEERFSAYQRVGGTFRKIGGYLDSDELASKCFDLSEKAREEIKRENTNKSHDYVIQEDLIEKQNDKFFIIIVLVVGVLFLAATVYQNVWIPAENYSKAEELFETGDYSAAIAAFEALGDYRDAKDRVGEIKQIQATNEAQNVAAWLSGTWSLTMTSCLDENGKAETESTICKIEALPPDENGIITATISSDTSSSLEGLAFLILDDRASLLSPDSSMDGRIEYGINNTSFDFYVESMESVQGEKLILADNGFYIKMTFDKTSAQIPIESPQEVPQNQLNYLYEYLGCSADQIFEAFPEAYYWTEYTGGYNQRIMVDAPLDNPFGLKYDFFLNNEIVVKFNYNTNSLYGLYPHLVDPIEYPPPILQIDEYVQITVDTTINDLTLALENNPSLHLYQLVETDYSYEIYTAYPNGRQVNYTCLKDTFDGKFGEGVTNESFLIEFYFGGGYG